MVQDSRPWDDTGPGDAGPYSAEQWAATWRSFFTGKLAAYANAGIILRSGDGTHTPLLAAVTSPATNQIRVYPGEALVNGHHYISDAEELITINPNPNPNPRITRIVLRQDGTAQTVRLATLDGTAAASPVAPSLTQSTSPTGIFEIPIAQVAVPAGFGVISTGVTDERVQAMLVPPLNGGTGISSTFNPYSKGMLVAGKSADELGQTLPMIDFGLFVGDSSKDTNISVIDQRPHKLKGPHAATWAVQRPANTANGTLIAFDAAEMYNPAGYITNLAANLFRLAAGTYLVSGVLNIGNEDAASFQCQWWIANNAAPSTYLVQAPEIYVGPEGSGATSASTHAVMIDEILESTGVEDFGLRFRSFNATAAISLSLDGSSGVQYFLSFRRIK